MKKINLLIFLFICIILPIFSEQINRIDDSNIYMGITIEILIDEVDQIELGYSRIIQYYDSQNRLVKAVATPTENFTRIAGLIEQTNHYIDGFIVSYEKLFNEHSQNINVFNRIIEDVNENGIIYRRTWYYNNIVLDVSEVENDLFNFINIEYLEELFFENYVPNKSGDAISISARYVRNRSVIRFDTELVNLDEEDFQNMRYLEMAYGFQSMEHLFSKKVKVFSENSSYWFYVQTGLEQHILGQNATIRFYPIGKNRELFLIGIGFYDIRD